MSKYGFRSTSKRPPQPRKPPPWIFVPPPSAEEQARLDDLSSDSDDEYFDVVQLPGLRPPPPTQTPSTSPVPDQPQLQQPQPQSPQGNAVQDASPLLPPAHSQSMPAVNKGIAPGKMGNAQPQPLSTAVAADSKQQQQPANTTQQLTNRNSADCTNLANAINVLAPSSAIKSKGENLEKEEDRLKVQSQNKPGASLKGGFEEKTVNQSALEGGSPSNASRIKSTSTNDPGVAPKAGADLKRENSLLTGSTGKESTKGASNQLSKHSKVGVTSTSQVGDKLETKNTPTVGGEHNSEELLKESKTEVRDSSKEGGKVQDKLIPQEVIKQTTKAEESKQKTKSEESPKSGIKQKENLAKGDTKEKPEVKVSLENKTPQKADLQKTNKKEENLKQGTEIEDKLKANNTDSSIKPEIKVSSLEDSGQKPANTDSKKVEVTKTKVEESNKKENKQNIAAKVPSKESTQEVISRESKEIPDSSVISKMDNNQTPPKSTNVGKDKNEKGLKTEPKITAKFDPSKPKDIPSVSKEDVSKPEGKATVKEGSGVPLTKDSKGQNKPQETTESDRKQSIAINAEGSPIFESKKKREVMSKVSDLKAKIADLESKNIEKDLPKPTVKGKALVSGPKADKKLDDKLNPKENEVNASKSKLSKLTAEVKVNKDAEASKVSEDIHPPKESEKPKREETEATKPPSPLVSDTLNKGKKNVPVVSGEDANEITSVVPKASNMVSTKPKKSEAALEPRKSEPMSSKSEKPESTSSKPEKPKPMKSDTMSSKPEQSETTSSNLKKSEPPAPESEKLEVTPSSKPDKKDTPNSAKTEKLKATSSTKLEKSGGKTNAMTEKLEVPSPSVPEKSDNAASATANDLENTTSTKPEKLQSTNSSKPQKLETVKDDTGAKSPSNETKSLTKPENMANLSVPNDSKNKNPPTSVNSPSDVSSSKSPPIGITAKKADEKQVAASALQTAPVTRKVRAGSPTPGKSAVMGVKLNTSVVTGKLNITPNSGPGPPGINNDSSAVVNKEVKSENDVKISNSTSKDAAKPPEINGQSPTQEKVITAIVAEENKNTSKEITQSSKISQEKPSKENVSSSLVTEKEKCVNGLAPVIVNGVLNDSSLEKTSSNKLQSAMSDQSIPQTNRNSVQIDSENGFSDDITDRDDFEDFSELETFVDRSRCSSVASDTSRTMSPDVSLRTGARRKSEKLSAMMNLWENEEVSQISEKSKLKPPPNKPKVGKISGLKNMFESGKATDKPELTKNPNLPKLRSQSSAAIVDPNVASAMQKKVAPGGSGIASMNAAKFGGTSKFKKPQECSPSAGDKILKRERSNLFKSNVKTKDNNSTTSQEKPEITNETKDINNKKSEEIKDQTNDVSKEKKENGEVVGQENSVKVDVGKEKSDKDDVGKEKSDKVDVGKEKSDKLDVGKEKSDKVDVGKEKANKVDVGKEKSDKVDVGKEKSDKVDVGKDKSDKVDVGKEKSDKLDVGKEKSDKVDVGKEKADKVDVGKEKSDKVDVGKEKSDKINVGKDKSGKVDVVEKGKLEKVGPVEKEKSIDVGKEHAEKDKNILTKKSEKGESIVKKKPEDKDTKNDTKTDPIKNNKIEPNKESVKEKSTERDKPTLDKSPESKDDKPKNETSTLVPDAPKIGESEGKVISGTGAGKEVSSISGDSGSRDTKKKKKKEKVSETSENEKNEMPSNLKQETNIVVENSIDACNAVENAQLSGGSVINKDDAVEKLKVESDIENKCLSDIDNKCLSPEQLSNISDERSSETNSNESKFKGSKKLVGIKSFIESAVAKGGKTLEDKLSKTGIVGKKSRVDNQKESPTLDSKSKRKSGVYDVSVSTGASDTPISLNSDFLNIKSMEDLGKDTSEYKETLAKAVPALESEVASLIKEASDVLQTQKESQKPSYLPPKLTLPLRPLPSVASFPDPPGSELCGTSLPASPTKEKAFDLADKHKVFSLPASPTKEVHFNFEETSEGEEEVFVDAIDPGQLDTLMPLPDVQGERDVRSRSRTPMDYRERSVTPSPVIAESEAILSETDRLLRRSRSNKSLRRSYSRSLSNATLNRLSEVTADLSEEHTTAHLAGERLEAEQAERMKLEKEIDRLQTDVKRMTSANGKLEMEKIALRSEVLSAAELNGDLDDDEAADASLYKRKYEWCLREIELLKKQSKQQQEDDLDQLLLLKKQLEKKVADAYEETDEQRQVVAQLKRKSQRLQAEMNDLKILLEEQTSRNNLLEKKQRKFDQEVMAVQEELRHERTNKDKIQRERDQILSEKYSFEQEVTTLKLELELKEEKVSALNRELDDLTSSGKVEEEVASLKKTKHDLELRIKDQEEELDDLAGQVQMLEGAKVRLEMSMEQMRKENRREISQREEELEDIRMSAQKKVKSLEAQLENEHEERTLLVREKHELERRIADLQERTITHVDEDYVHKLKKELKKTKALLRDTQTMLEKAQSEGSHKLILRQLKTQLEDAEFAKTAALKARQCAESDLSDVSSQLDETLRAKKEAEDKCARVNKERAEIQTQLEESEEEVAEVMKKYKAVVSQLSVDQITLSEQSQQIAELEHSKQVLQERMLELSSKVEVLEGETANIHTQRRLEMKIKEIESKLELELTTRQRLESQIGRLKDQIERLSGECDTAKMKESQALDQTKRLGRQLRDAKDDLTNVQQRYTEVTNKKSELEKQLELSDAEVVTLKSDLKLAFKRIEDLQQAIQGDISDSDSELSDSDSDSDGSLSSYLTASLKQQRSSSNSTLRTPPSEVQQLERLELPHSPCSEAMSAISEDFDETSNRESSA